MKRVITVGIFFLCIVSNFFSQNAASSLYRRAVELQQKEDWQSASQYFLDTVHANPAYSDAWFRLAQCTYQLGQYDLALQYLDSAEKYSRSDTAIKNLRGMCYLSLGRTTDAKNIFETVLRSSPNDVDARFGLAELELLDGRITAAETRYLEAISRDATNRKALLSLAFISAGQGKRAAAQNYMNTAMRFYSGEPAVHYLSAGLAAMNGNYAEAERQARSAISLNSNYDKAYEMLASSLYEQKKYNEVISVCDTRISRNRNSGTAWYLKGLALQKLNRSADAISAWTTGLSVSPQDEVMRFAIELQVNKALAIEDGRRKSWAQYHIKNADNYAKRFDYNGASFEYQRALKVDPANETARLAFANMLELNGLHELYLEQLKFLQSIRENPERTIRQIRMDDRIEAFDSLLQDALAKRWEVQPFYLDKIRWHLGIYYTPKVMQFVHADNAQITAEALADMFSGISVTSVRAEASAVAGFSDAYRSARDKNEDYFVVISVEEGERDITLSGTMYSGRTGTVVKRFSFYGTGNNRYTNVLRRFRSDILSGLPIRGKILDRSGSDLLIDVGKSELVQNGAVFNIVRKGALRVADSNLGLTYSDSDLLGTITITETGEEVSEGVLTKRGFYDRVNINDEVILLSMPSDDATAENPSNVVDNVPSANQSGVRVVTSTITQDDVGGKAVPAFIDFIRDIY
ncbi:MAG: tetratricopeptide repeat protein [Treponema sp.]|nr:tetratricopeptide repeat protein [Treponema sp.]